MGCMMAREAAATRPLARVADTGLEAVSVLVIDDHVNMRRIVSGILQALGVEYIYEASDGADGFEAMRSHRPDIVIVDWEMPGIDGVEFTQLVRTASDSPNPYVPIIFLTSYSDKYHVVEARDAGATEFLAKPVSAKAMFTRLMAIINKPRSFVRSPTYFGPCRRRRVDNEYNGPERRHEQVPLEA